MKKRDERRKTLLALVVSVTGSSLLSERAARAQDTLPPQPRDIAVPSRTLDDESEHRPVRLGALAGVGFPRPLAVEALIVADEVVALGAEYGVLPTVVIDDVRATLWSVAADARIFPLRGPFFLGLRAGRQHVGATTTVTVAPFGSATEDLALDSWFLNPRIGCLWTSEEGLAFGFEAGVQIPLTSNVDSSLPLELVPGAQRAADSLGKTLLPTVDLFRIGFLL